MENMKFFLSVFIILSSIKLAYSQTNLNPKDIKHCLDTVFKATQTNSVYQKNVDWDKVKAAYYKLGDDVKTNEDLSKPFLYLQEQLGDFHGKVVINDTITLQYQKQEEMSPEMLTFIGTIQSQAEKLLYIPFQGSFYATMIDDIAFIVVPNNDGFGQNAQVYFDTIQKTIQEFEKKKPKGWILDFRCNQGGAVFPMICATSSFLRNGKIAEIQYGNGSTENWSVKNGQLITKDSSFFYGIPHKIKKRKVAILTEATTASSGEQTVIALKQNKKTRIFGDSSSGYISGVDFIDLKNGIQFGYSTGYFLDINHTVYKDKIHPDEKVLGGDDFTDLKKDKKIIKAIEWLKNN